VDEAGRALRLRDSKEGVSVRPFGRAALDALPARGGAGARSHVFPRRRPDAPYGGLPGAWARIAKKAGLGAEVTLHTLRHSLVRGVGTEGTRHPAPRTGPGSSPPMGNASPAAGTVPRPVAGVVPGPPRRPGSASCGHVGRQGWTRRS
jgi:hypothetical protein